LKDSKIEKLNVQEKLFNDLVMEWNKKVNLVSRKRPDVFDLIEDSKLFFDSIDFSREPAILDLGTGGGFPGIVLKIHYPEANITLLDSIKKKVKAVRDIARRLGFEEMAIMCARAEELARQKDFRNSFDYVVAHWVSALDRLAKWSRDLLKPGGKLITLKGGALEQEIQRTQRLKFVKNCKITGKNAKEIIEITFG